MRHNRIGGYTRLNEKRDIKDKQSPFIFPSCSQTVAHLQWWKMRKKRTICERGKRIYKNQHNYKILESNHILQRPHVSYINSNVII